MLAARRSAVLYLVIIVLLFYGWIGLFWENEWMKSIGASLFPLIAGATSFFWLFKAYRRINGKQRYFWLILSIGMLFYFVSSAFLFFMQMVRWEPLSPEISSLTWLLASVSFLAALIYKTKLMSASFSHSSYVFNIFLFITMVSAASIHYLIKPTLEMADNSISVTLTALIYQVTNLSILFVAASLYRLSQHRKEKRIMFFLITGLVLQVIIDTSLAYQSAIGGYQAGSLLQPIIIVSLLLIGMTGLYVRDDREEPEWEMKEILRGKDAFFPYASVIFFIVLELYSYQWDFNALSIGLGIIFLLITGRQLMVMKKNEQLMQEYRHLAYHDPLTGLNNRTTFQEELSRFMDQANRFPKKAALLIIDLDRFKNVNDTLGHQAGDNILKIAADRLRKAAGPNDRIYRIGGDEFIIFLPDADKRHSEQLAETVINEFSNSFSPTDYDMVLTPSIGISLYPEHGMNSETLFKHADAAMYLAKENGRNGFQFYNTELNAILTRKMKIEHGLRKALPQNQLKLFYQPIVNLDTRVTIGLEALIRWEHPELGFISPDEFIPIAEETGQIIPIGEWVLKTAASQTKKWQEEGFSSLFISVNVSVRQFQDYRFVPMVRTILQETNLRPACLELEITESIVQNLKESTDVLNDLRELGVKASIDDFGTGYSSLHVLRNLPIDTIKMDKAFLEDLGERARDSMVKTIIDIGMNLQLDVIAEGIEFNPQLNMLKEKGFRYGQGYLFSKPLPMEECGSFLARNTAEKFIS